MKGYKYVYIYNIESTDAKLLSVKLKIIKIPGQLHHQDIFADILSFVNVY